MNERVWNTSFLLIAAACSWGASVVFAPPVDRTEAEERTAASDDRRPSNARPRFGLVRVDFGADGSIDLTDRISIGADCETRTSTYIAQAPSGVDEGC